MFGDKIIPEQSDKIDLKKLVAEADLLNWRSFNTWCRSSKISY